MDYIISVLIVNYNSADFIENSLYALSRLTKNPFKVFIIDNRTVITGSMNPTGSGDYKNDENILITRDKEVAEKYVGEFFRLFNAQ